MWHGTADGAGLEVRRATLGEHRRRLQESEHPACVARCVPDQLSRRGLIQGVGAGEAELRVVQRPRRDRRQLRLAERLETEHAQPRQERRGDRAGDGRLGRRADQDDGARLHVGQERILLGLAVAMDLVEEDDGGAALQGGGAASGVDHAAQRRHAVGGGVQGLEPRPDRLREQPADGRLAGARRAPQDAGGQAAALDQAAKRRPRPEEGGLADHLVQRPGAHPVRERPEVKRRGEKRAPGRCQPRDGPRSGGPGRWRAAGLGVRRPGGSR